LRLDGAARPVRISMRNVVGRPVLEVGARARVSWDPRAFTVFT
jgi:spermidine/putrescine transport system ATP-binding protein